MNVKSILLLAKFLGGVKLTTTAMDMAGLKRVKEKLAPDENIILAKVRYDKALQCLEKDDSEWAEAMYTLLDSEAGKIDDSIVAHKLAVLGIDWAETSVSALIMRALLL